MISNNKILTVSYGTFSCTLEGFDDSFGTMKAIAEYFRDLAADDRYFGAEPPQPDVDMLARIAQKEVSRRVEAREHEGKIVLSAVDDAPTPEASSALAGNTATATAATALLHDAQTPPAEEPAQSVADQDAEPIAEAPVAEEPAPQNTEAAPEELDTSDVVAAQDAAQEDVAQEPVQEEEVAPSVEEVVETQEDASEDTSTVEDTSAVEDEVEDDTLAADAAETPVAEFVEDENDIVPGQPDAEVEAFFASSPTGTDQNEFEEIAEVSATPQEPVEAASDAGANSIAAKLQRIRAVVAQQDDSNQADDDDTAQSEDEFEAEAESLADLDLDADTDPITSEASDPPTEQEALDVVSDEPTASDEQPLEEALSDLDMADDTAEDAGLDSIDEVLDAREAAEEDDIAAILSRLDAAEAAEADTQASADPLMADDDLDELDTDEALENLFEAEDESAEDAAVAAEVSDVDDAPASVYQAVAKQRVDVEPPKTPAEEALADAAEAMAARGRRARVIKVKRADLEAAINRGDLEEYDNAPPKRADLDPAHAAPPKFGTSSLSPEDEAELARELAALEADIEMDEAETASEEVQEDVREAMTLSEDMRADDDLDPAFDDEDWTAEDSDLSKAEDALAEAEQETAEDAYDEESDDAPNASGRDALPSLDAEKGGDMSRLLAEADQQMGEPESATRRDAFAHLRAAVAAKKADDALGVGTDTEQGDDAYRNDLADVVRPRRPDRSGAKTPRPGDGGPAPLKLVAEQRIDEDNPTPAGPVRPRRVATVDDPSSEGESFADFAIEMGATTLPQQLEAAAAYMSFVEGREQFSRPQLMTKVRQVNAQDGFSREDGLRHFGQLLRAGKIEKVKGGRFTVSDDIGFRPDHRAAS